jgi:hypothetical protein
LLDEASRVRSSDALIRAEEKPIVALWLAAVAVEAMVIATAAQAMRPIKLKLELNLKLELKPARR